MYRPKWPGLMSSRRLNSRFQCGWSLKHPQPPVEPRRPADRHRQRDADLPPEAAALNACSHVNHVLHVDDVATARNITLTLDDEILQEARVLAAKRGLSVSAFLRTELANLVERQRGYAKAREAALQRLRRGQSLGGGKLASREELHDRAKLR